MVHRRLIPVATTLSLTLAVALSGCGGQALPDKANETLGPSPEFSTPSASTPSVPNFDARRAAARLAKQLRREGDSFQFRYVESVASVARGKSVIEGVTLEDAMAKAKVSPLEPTDQVFEGTLYAPYYGKTISSNPLVVNPFFDHKLVWVIRRFHIETASSQKMGYTPSPSPTTYFVDLVMFLGPDGTFVAPELPELDQP